MTKLLRIVDARLVTLVPDRGHRRNLRFYVLYRLVTDLIGKPDPSTTSIRDIDLDRATDEAIDRAHEVVNDAYQALGANDVVAKGSSLLPAIRNR